MTGILPPRRTLEAVELRCSLGVRFRDPATSQVIGWGLRVSAFPLGAPWPDALRRWAQPNRSGAWVFHDLVGLRDYELGGDEPEGTGSPPRSPQFRIEVQDEEERFLPFCFTAIAPTRGLFQLAPADSPVLDWKDVPLFSAPQRPVPPACGVIRTCLVASAEERPAAWALLEATTMIRNQLIQVLGVADPQGSVALMFPWPELTGLAFSSPPGGLRLETQGWEFEFAAWHDFEATVGNSADLDAVLARLSRIPDQLRTELTPLGEFSRAQLTFGQELVVPDQGARTDHKRQLLIMPAG